jgi:hypothetical protein
MPSLPTTILKEPRGYEGVQVAAACSSLGVGTLSRLGTAAASVQNPDGSVSEGNWHWWTSDQCPAPGDDLADAQRISMELEPCPRPHVPGTTCIRRWYPERTLYPDGSFREQSWEFRPSAPDRDVMGLRMRWDIYFNPEEARIYAALQNDEYLKALDARAVIGIYYSLLQWKCTGKIDAKLNPSPVSPQGLAGRYNDESQVWLEFWERGLRDRIWMVRSDLRQVRLPDGRLETGLRPPADISRPPACTSTAGQVIGYVAAAVLTLAGMPPALEIAMNLPNTVLGLRDLISKLSMASQIQNALMGVPSPVEQKLIAQASGETKSPTGAVGAVGGASGIPLWLLAAGAAVLLS